jgi:putative FmdB family regulatory protein
MPLYEFICTTCGKTFELILTVDGYEREERQCPHCRSRNVERVMSGISVITSKKS